MEGNVVPAGWYEDPNGSGVRYWDGSAWTQHTAAHASPIQQVGSAIADARAAAPAPPVAAQAAAPSYWSQLESEKVVVSAPLSFHGSAARIWKITKTATGGAQAALIVLAIVLITLAWTFVLCWYALWGFWLVPYRLIRRGSRKRKRDALQHREMIAAIQGQHRR